ncbi:MAG: hypothetical protein PGN13_15070 [Patulibacter minatonensis]
MSNFKLSLPTDIPWKRICVTEDMIDERICDGRAPGKWQTSLAVFKYVPEEEDQLYPDYDISYLKVTATITGYQPLDQEVQGHIDWDGVDVSTIPGLTDLLNSYNPCHGAVLQVSVAPKGGADAVTKKDYPFFLDFEPKKRELYELATDTKEKQSRSIESLNITKSSGSTQSTEILDVDMGGGGFGAQASYAGTGGGFSYSAPNGQWGTKRLNADESLASRTTDVGQEKRETFSYTTQLSQMYHLLDSYHLGTNRAVFFVQPRPHTLEEPSGFVRGPRPVEGIQEFFLVVARPKGQRDYCVSLRLDTSHITTTPIMDYERRSDQTSIASATAPVAGKHDTRAERIVGARACFIDCWDVMYQCYRTSGSDTVNYSAPAGFRIVGYDNLVNDSDHGSSSVSVTPNGQSLTINANANGHICFEDSGVCVDCPDEIQQWSGHARRQVQVNLISTTPTKKVGEEQVLMITTRGLCCCDAKDGRVKLEEKVVGIRPLPKDLTRVAARSAGPGVTATTGAQATRELRSAAVTHAHDHADGPCTECSEKIAEAQAAASSPGLTIRQANALSDHIKTETLRNLNDPYAKPERFIDTDFFAKQLEQAVVQTRRGRELLARPAADVLPKAAVAKLGKQLGSEGELALSDVWSLRSTEVAEITGLTVDQVRAARLTSAGVAVTGKQLATRPDPKTTKTTAR